MAHVGCRPGWRCRSTASPPSSTWWPTARAAPCSRATRSPRPSAYTAQAIGTPGAPPLRIALSLATSLQRPATPAQKAALALIRRTVPQVFGHG